MDTRLKIQQLLIKTKGRLFNRCQFNKTASVVGHLTRLDPYLNVVYFKQCQEGSSIAAGQTKMFSLWNW